MSTISKAFAISSVIVVGLPVIAHAHPVLQSTVPIADRAGAVTSPQAPSKQVRLKFSEDVMAKFSGIDLKDDTGRKVATGAPATDPTDPQLLIVPVTNPLAPGRYTVIWHAVSEDTHRVKGEYSFTIAK